jgi:peptidoglycan/LPS O-acetylase OafA/YrhL
MRGFRASGELHELRVKDDLDLDAVRGRDAIVTFWQDRLGRRAITWPHNHGDRRPIRVARRPHRRWRAVLSNQSVSRIRSSRAGLLTLPCRRRMGPLGSCAHREVRMPRRHNSSDHIAALDGLRGIAILAVMSMHFIDPPGASKFVPRPHTLAQTIGAVANGGWMGVDLFFVLSGFLITGILLRAKNSPTYFRSFYARRILRIFPLYYGTMLTIFVLQPAFITLRDPISREWYSHQGWLWAHSLNLFVALHNRFLEVGWISLGHFWSLSVEEQFYLCWPFIVAALSSRALLRLSMGLTLTALALRCLFVFRWDLFNAAYVFTPCRMDGLAIGAIVALSQEDTELGKRMVQAAPKALVLSGAILSVVFAREHFIAWGRWTSSIGFTVVEVFCGAVLLLVLDKPYRPLSAALSNPILRWFGKYSYGAYVLHPLLEPWIQIWLPIERVVRVTGSEVAGVVGCAGFGIGVSMVAALACWHLYEKHFLTLKRYFEYVPPEGHAESWLPPSMAVPAVAVHDEPGASSMAIAPPEASRMA